jgi:hypothetical protein
LAAIIKEKIIVHPLMAISNSIVAVFEFLLDFCFFELTIDSDHKKENTL